MRDKYCIENCLSVVFESSFTLLAGGQLYFSPENPTLVIRKDYIDEQETIFIYQLIYLKNMRNVFICFEIV